MKKQISISLLLIGAVLLIGIIVPNILAKGNKTSQAEYTPPALASAIPLTPRPSFKGSIPNLTPTIDLVQSKDCTYTDVYWKDHPESWPDQVEIATNPITKEQAVQLMKAPSTDIPIDLQRVLYVTLLNIHSGAERGPVDKTIQDAFDWLAAHPPGTQMSDFNQSIVASFIQVLEDYNNGVTGPGLCLNQPPTPTATNSVEEQAQTPTRTQPAKSVNSRQWILLPTPTKQPPPPPPAPTATPIPPTPTSVPPTNTPLPPKPTVQPPTIAPTPAPTHKPKHKGH
jgi:hypothetical protein